MRFVTDTHCLLWYLVGDPRLSALSRNLFDEGGRPAQVVVSTIVLAELLYLSRRYRPPVSFEETLKWLGREERFEICPLSVSIIEEAIPLKALEIHDALIAATALHLNVPLMTADNEIAEADVVKTLRP